MHPITFSVSYTLREYLDFVHHHALVIMNQELLSRNKPPMNKMPIWIIPFILIPAAMGFIFKKREMPVCKFRIDECGIVRTTDAGPYEMLWQDVAAIHKYPSGYLVTCATGAFPLPNRCFDSGQFAEFSALVEKWHTATQAAS